MNEPFSLAGETALITGGGTGLGLGIARCFVAAGARVVLVGRRAEVLETAAQELGPAAEWITHDILQLSQANVLVSEAVRRVGLISILVNNAGIHIKKSAVELTPEEFQSVLQTHLTAAFAVTRAVLPAMIERKHGNILFSASMASLIGIPSVSAYSAAKAGHLGLVRSLATEVSQHGVRVNAIAPGWIMTQRQIDKWLTPEALKELDARQCLKRKIMPDEVARFAVFLASEEASACTAQHYIVDGGWV